MKPIEKNLTLFASSRIILVFALLLVGCATPMESATKAYSQKNYARAYANYSFIVYFREPETPESLYRMGLMMLDPNIRSALYQYLNEINEKPEYANWLSINNLDRQNLSNLGFQLGIALLLDSGYLGYKESEDYLRSIGYTGEIVSTGIANTISGIHDQIIADISQDVANFTNQMIDIVSQGMSLAAWSAIIYYGGIDSPFVTEASASNPDPAGTKSSSTNSFRSPSINSCTSDFSCGTGFVCVKSNYQGVGTCIKSLDTLGAPNYQKSFDSLGRSSQVICAIHSDCSIGFSCDSHTGTCVR